jgi:hypothetical protein
MATAQMTAARPQEARPRWVAALVAAGFALGVVASIATVQATRGLGQQAPAVIDGSASLSDSSLEVFTGYSQTVADLAAAMRRHDSRSIARFRSRLEGQMTASTIQAIHAQRQELLAGLDAAQTRHDPRMAAYFTARLASLCPPTQVASTLSFCD